MQEPNPRVNPVDEPPTEFERYGLELLRAIADARRRGAAEEHRRLLDELEEYEQRKAHLRDALRGEW